MFSLVQHFMIYSFFQLLKTIFILTTMLTQESVITHVRHPRPRWVSSRSSKIAEPVNVRAMSPKPYSSLPITFFPYKVSVNKVSRKSYSQVDLKAYFQQHQQWKTQSLLGGKLGRSWRLTRPGNSEGTIVLFPCFPSQLWFLQAMKIRTGMAGRNESSHLSLNPSTQRNRSSASSQDP